MDISRRDFIKRMSALGLSAAAAGSLFAWLSCTGNKPVSSPAAAPPVSIPTPSSQPPAAAPVAAAGVSHVAVAHGTSPAGLVQAAVKALGGIEQFVKNGDNVIIKPNICVAYHTPEYAATTNPEVVGTLVKLCLGAGAKRVRVMDFPFGGTAEQAYDRSGISEAVKNAGGQMELMSSMKFREVDIPQGIDIKKWSVYGDAMDADVLITVPIAKHHNMARLTLGMKNLMGLIQSRNQFHTNLGQRIADLTSLLKPTLTIVDAVRILMNHGPTGGNLDDVKMTNTVIASRDIVAADAYAAILFDLTGNDIPAVRLAAQMGLGNMDMKNIKLEQINI